MKDSLTILDSLTCLKNYGSALNPCLVAEISLDKGNGQADAKVIRDELRSLRPPFLSDELVTVITDLDEYIADPECDAHWADCALTECEAEIRQAITDHRRTLAAESITYPMFA